MFQTFRKLGEIRLILKDNNNKIYIICSINFTKVYNTISII